MVMVVCRILWSGSVLVRLSSGSNVGSLKEIDMYFIAINCSVGFVFLSVFLIVVRFMAVLLGSSCSISFRALSSWVYSRWCLRFLVKNAVVCLFLYCGLFCI